MNTSLKAAGRAVPLQPRGTTKESARVTTPPDEITPGLFASAWRFRWLSLAITLAVAGTSVLAGVLLAPPPTATVVMSVTSPQADNVLAPAVVGDATLTRYTAQRADYVTSDDVLNGVSSAIGASPDAIRRRLTVSPSASSSVITIVGTGKTRAEAASLANAVVDSYRAATKADVAKRTDAVTASIDGDIKKIKDSVRGLPSGPESQAAAQSIAQLESKASGVRTDNVSYGDGIDWATRTTPHDVVVAGPPLKEGAIGLLVGLAASMVIAWLLSDRKRQVVTSGRASELLDVPLLGIASQAIKPEGRSSEVVPVIQQQSLATASIALRARADRGTVVIVGLGGTLATHDVAMGIAAGLTMQGSATLVVEADFAHGSRIHPGKEKTGVTGFATMLADIRGVTTAKMIHTDLGQGRQVEVMPLGPIPQGQSWNVGGLPIALATLQEGHDFVVIDGGLLDSSHITAALCATGDALVFVLPDHVDEEDVLAARSMVETLQANVIGYIYLGSDDH